MEELFRLTAENLRSDLCSLAEVHFCEKRNRVMS